MTIYTVCFFGHRYIDDPFGVDSQIYELVCNLIHDKEYVDFLIGRDGEFDQLVSSAIIRAKRNIFDANSSHIWIMPYIKAEYTKNSEDYDKYYDEVEICERSARCHPKAAITIRNQYMIRRSNLCVFYINHNHGGAFNALQYAKNSNKDIIIFN